MQKYIDFYMIKSSPTGYVSFRNVSVNEFSLFLIVFSMNILIQILILMFFLLHLFIF